jgi:hypothetical protein
MVRAVLTMTVLERSSEAQSLASEHSLAPAPQRARRATRPLRPHEYRRERGPSADCALPRCNRRMAKRCVSQEQLPGASSPSNGNFDSTTLEVCVTLKRRTGGARGLIILHLCPDVNCPNQTDGSSPPPKLEPFFTRLAASAASCAATTA